MLLEHVKSAKPVKLGFLPAHRDVFDMDAGVREKRKIAQKLQEMDVEFADIEWLNDSGLLYDPADAPAVIEHFKKEGVDAVFPAHCTFGDERSIGRVCKALDKPILLWGARDEAPDSTGLRERDTQCGLFATSKLLRRLNLPYTYIVNSTVEDQVFQRGLDNFLRAVNVVRSMPNARIGQVDTRPGPFTTVMVNESELMERFGVETVPVALSTVIDRVKRLEDSEEVTAQVQDIQSRMNTEEIEERMLRRLAALKLTLARWAEEEKLDGIALQCWDAMQLTLDICPCFVHGEVMEMGVPVACETDIHGALSAIALQAAARCETAVFFADLTIRHPENDNSELLWHCGPFPASLAADPDERKLTGHYIIPSGPPAVGNWRIKGGNITLGRFDGDHGEYKMLLGHVRGCDGPFTRGNYVWVEVDDWPKWEETFVYGPYVHHVAGVHGKLAPALYEACKYMDVEAEAVEPTEEQIRSYLRGGEL